MDILIRKVEPGDLDAVARIEAACFPAAEAAPGKVLAQRIATFPDSFFVAVKDGKAAGFINGCATDERVICDPMFEDLTYHKPEGRYQSIFGLDVLPEYRHQGIARRLMEHMIQDARERGRRGLILTCKEHLMGFYGSFGYRSLCISESVHGGAVWYDMILEFENLREVP